jgi:hypothetical protein
MPADLMPEVAHPSEYHGHRVFVGCGDHLIVSHRPSGLNNGAYTCLMGCINTVPKRKKGIGSHHRTRYLQSLIGCLDGGDLGGVDATHLTGTNTEGAPVSGIDYGVGFNEFYHSPGK